jgi:hypothetical protein
VCLKLWSAPDTERNRKGVCILTKQNALEINAIHVRGTRKKYMDAPGARGK